MLGQEKIEEVIDAQRKYFVSKRTDQIRDSLGKIPIEKGKATVITGMRRCGKCTLLLQMQKEKDYQDVVYLNFEDIRLAGFSAEDFRTLLEEVTSRGTKTVFFDEIHIMEGWKDFVKELLNLGVTVFITDTNMTVRDMPFAVSLELFPFSYKEYIDFSHQSSSLESFIRYMKIGGIPKIVRNEGTSIMNNILDDIVVRDIAVRNGIREVDALRRLAVYLLSNTGKEVAANQLIGAFGIRSCATIVDFFKYYRESYLMEMIPKFSPSERVRSRNPKRVYAMDLGLINVISAVTSLSLSSTSSAVSPAVASEQQRKLENAVFAHLRRRYRDITYFSEKRLGECHFIALRDGVPVEAVHVCRYLSEYNKFLTYQNFAKVLPQVNLTEATVVTMDQKQTFPFQGVTIHIVPAYEWMS